MAARFLAEDWRHHVTLDCNPFQPGEAEWHFDYAVGGWLADRDTFEFANWLETINVAPFDFESDDDYDNLDAFWEAE